MENSSISTNNKNNKNNINYKETPNNLNQTRTKNTLKEIHKTPKNLELLPILKKANNKLFKKNGSDLFANQQYYDPDILKQQLNSCKTKLQEQSSYYLSLKIKYSKLNNDNLYNKNLISNILGTPFDQLLSKEEFLDKIENITLTNDKKHILEEAYETIKLKIEINEKKEKSIKLQKYLKEIEENSKSKKIKEIYSDLLSKFDEQRNLLRILKCLNEKTNEFDIEVKKLNEVYDKESAEKKEKTKIKEEKMSEYDNLIEERNELYKQNKLNDEKLKKLMINYKDKKDKNETQKADMLLMIEELNDINKYKEEKEDLINKLEEKKKLDDEFKKNKKEQESELDKLTKECDDLNMKSVDNETEKSKLIKKSKISKSDMNKLKSLEDELNEQQKIKEKENKILEKKIKKSKK